VRIRVPALVSALLVLVSACGGSGATKLEPYELPGPQLVMDRPSEWLAVTEGRATLFAETQEAKDAAYLAPRPPVTALTIVFDHRLVEFMRTIGFVTEPFTNEDLFEFNRGNFGWEVIGEIGTVDVLGTEALRARVTTRIGVSEVIQGSLPTGEEIFLLELSGPDEASLDDFLSVWEAIIASLAPIG